MPTHTHGIFQDGTHRFPVTVYYEDTDAGGIVYHASFVRFAERSRTEALRLAGIRQSELKARHGIGFVVRRMGIEYDRPGLLDDHLVVETALRKMGATSMTMRQDVLRGGERIVGMEVVIVCIGPDMRPARIPDAVRTALLSHMPIEL